MKRYECRFVAALVLSLFLPLTVMCYPRTISRVPKSPTTGRRGPSSGNYRQNQRKNHVINQEMQCTESQSSFLRSQCGDRGFMTVTRNRVLVQTSGLSANHSEAEFVIEVCSRARPEFWLSSLTSFTESTEPLVRYRHRSSNKYICFKRNGAVRAVAARHVEGRRSLCMFKQIPVETRSPYEDRTYHRIQSAHNPKWHLGFQHKTVPLRDRRPHRGALSRSWARRSFNLHKCDFKFHAGQHRAQARDHIFSGLEDLIQEQGALHSSQSSHSKAALNSDTEISSNELSNDFSQVETDSAVSEVQISSVHKKKLQQQQVLRRYKQYPFQRKIRHLKHKRPRPSRAEKNGLRVSRRKQPMSKYQNFV